MAYQAPTWVNGTTPAINATNLQALSNAVAGMQCYPQVSVAEARNAIGLGNTAGALPIANGGTGSTTAADARTNLGVLGTSGGTMTGDLEIGSSATSNLGTVYKDVHRTSGIKVGCVNGDGTFAIYDNDNYKSVITVTAAGACTFNGNASTATALATPRGLLVNLQNSDTVYFDGTANTVLGVAGILPVSKGGTGNSSGNAALNGFLAAGVTVLSSYQYGNSLPSTGTTGQIFFKKA